MHKESPLNNKIKLLRNAMSLKLVILDRDGVINQDSSDSPQQSHTTLKISMILLGLLEHCQKRGHWGVKTMITLLRIGEMNLMINDQLQYFICCFVGQVEL